MIGAPEIRQELDDSLQHFPELSGCRTVIQEVGDATFEVSIGQHGWMCTHVYFVYRDVLPSVVVSLCAAASMVADVEG